MRVGEEMTIENLLKFFLLFFMKDEGSAIAIALARDRFVRSIFRVHFDSVAIASEELHF